jgi:hypothetical protein
MERRSSLFLDGKEVRKFLFARFTRVKVSGCIPTDDGRKFIVTVQVEAFDKDHALKRLAEIYPIVSRKEWEYLDELDPEHDVGLMGASHPLNSLTMKAPVREQ